MNYPGEVVTFRVVRTFWGNSEMEKILAAEKMLEIFLERSTNLEKKLGKNFGESLKNQGKSQIKYQ